MCEICQKFGDRIYPVYDGDSEDMIECFEVEPYEKSIIEYRMVERTNG